MIENGGASRVLKFSCQLQLLEKLIDMPATNRLCPEKFKIPAETGRSDNVFLMTCHSHSAAASFIITLALHRVVLDLELCF